MFADMVGYTALMQEDERRAKLLRDRQREVLEDRVAKFEGEIIQFYGDGALSGFQSAIQAVECAIAIQVDLREEPEVPVRIGIHLGDVAFDKTGVYGDGVNIASRIESLSVPGGVLVSGKIADEVKNQPGISTEFLAEVALKNVKEAQRVFAVTNEDLAVPAPKEVKGWKRAGGRSGGGGQDWLKWAAVGVVAVGALGYAVLSDRGPTSSEVGGTPAARQSIGILPFRYEGPPGENEYLRGFFPGQLSSLLATGPFLPKDQATIDYRYRELEAEGLGGEELFRRIADQEELSLVISGTAMAEPNGSLNVHITLYDPRQEETADRISQVGSVDDPLEVAIGLAGQVLEEWSGLDPSFLGNVLTESIEASKAFHSANFEFLAGNYGAAAALFEEATGFDSTYALAYYRLSQARLWDWDFENARAPARRAWELSGSLSPVNRDLLQAWLAFLENDPNTADRLYERLWERLRDSPEILTGRGSVLAYYNPLRGRPSEEAVRFFRRVLDLNPHYGEARYHVLDHLARTGEEGEFMRLVRGVNPEGPQALPFQAVQAFAFGTRQDQEDVIRDLDRIGGDPLVFAAGRVAATLHDFPGAERLGLVLSESPDSEGYQNAGLGLLSALAFAQGRWRDADSRLFRLAEREEEWSREMRALFSLFLSILDDESIPGLDLIQLRDSVEAWAPEEGAILPSYFELFGPHAQHHQEFRLYLLGLLSAALDELDEAWEYSSELTDYGIGRPLTAPLTQALSLSVRAHVLRARGETGPALEELGKIDYFPRFEFISVSPFFSQALDRWLRGELLWELGDREAALAWYNTLSDGWGEFLFAGPAHLRQAQIYEELADTVSAINHYDKFLELWGDADPEFEGLLVGAEGALAALGAGNNPPQDPPR
jgi:tetratricopeptide (TPR) repeat protein